MFGALFFAYAVLRFGADSWPPPGGHPLPLLVPGIATLVLLASSVTLQRGLASIRRGRGDAFLSSLIATIILGSVFLALQIVVWLGLWDHGLEVASGRYGSIFYLLTAFHFLHVVVGLGLLLWLVPPAMRRAIATPRRAPVKVISMFWHFVDAVWVAIYLSVYVL
jgi:heme/copper-type cytochrome/quinol oxidase subunit 3